MQLTNRLPTGDQKIILNFNKLQAVASHSIIRMLPQAAISLNAITETEIQHSKQKKCKSRLSGEKNGKERKWKARNSLISPQSYLSATLKIDDTAQ